MKEGRKEGRENLKILIIFSRNYYDTNESIVGYSDFLETAFKNI